jgi:hypothetical protein
VVGAETGELVFPTAAVVLGLGLGSAAALVAAVPTTVPSSHSCEYASRAQVMCVCDPHVSHVTTGMPGTSRPHTEQRQWKQREEEEEGAGVGAADKGEPCCSQFGERGVDVVALRCGRAIAHTHGIPLSVTFAVFLFVCFFVVEHHVVPCNLTAKSALPATNVWVCLSTFQLIFVSVLVFMVSSVAWVGNSDGNLKKR